MKINSLHSINIAIRKSMLFSLIALVILSLIVLNVIYFKSQDYYNQKNIDEINANLQLLKAHISEKISIVASSNVFIDYLRSGAVSQQKNRFEFLNEVNNLKLKEISAMQISKSDNKQVIFAKGKQSPYFVVLPLCYFDRGLDSRLGQCSHNLTLYFKINSVVSNLHLINQNLTTCKSCKPIDFLADNKFGSFDVISSSKMPLFISIKTNEKFNFFLIDIFIVLFMAMLAIWTWRRTSHTLDRYITQPIINITNKLKNAENLTKNNEIDELSFLIDQIEEREEKLKISKINEKILAIGHMASQVAHDIRSPLAALNVMIKETFNIPEQQRVLIRNATQQINDIANNLLQQYSSNCIESSTTCNEQIAVHIDSIISEKRAQYKHLPIKIEFIIETGAYSAFAKVSATNFKRVLSNVINNAIEAIPKEGSVTVALTKISKFITITIKDNGVGMSQDLIEKIYSGGSISNKKNGIGIGLNSSLKYIEEVGGHLDIESKLNIGTVIKINLPSLNAPIWFAENIFLAKNSTIIVLDDDQSIHDVWDSRISNEASDANIKILHFFTSDELLSYDISKLNNIYFFCDFELIGHCLSGLDVIEKLKLTHNTFLVTSRYADIAIRKSCVHLAVKVIPKEYAALIPINIITPDHQANFSKKVDLVLIDDDTAFTDAWQLSATMRNRNIIVFNTLEEAREQINDYCRDVPIYIDSDLKSDIKGEEFAKTLFHYGFKNIYLATGHEHTSLLNEMYWIKGKVSKEAIL